jgi:hypothetical protein
MGTVKTTASWIAWTLAAAALAAEPILFVDKAQGDAALRMIRAGDTVRFHCLPCSDVAYSPVEVRSRELRPHGGRWRLLLNGDAVEVSAVYVDSGYGEGWENLALLLGFVDDSIARELKPSLAEASRLAPHTGRWAGTLGEAPVELELLVRERGLVGSYTAAGTAAGGDTFRLLATAFGGPRGAETLALIERDDDDRVTATLRGVLDAAGTFEGTRTPLDGSPAQAFALRRAK